MSTIENHPQFFTTTILEWRHILKADAIKEIIINSLKFLVDNKRVIVYSFVIMPNHVHIIWKIADNHTRSNVQRDFLKYTSQQIKFYLKKNNPEALREFRVESADREYQIWERNPLSWDIYNMKTFMQKLLYIHANPVHEKWSLCQAPEEYFYSSARFYSMNQDDWGFLTHYKD